jgi:prepilin peptidase CpaA
MTVFAAAALAVSAVAAATDLWHRRIPNWLSVGGFAFGLALHWRAGSWGECLQGAVIALAIHLPLFAMRWTSGGDVKLMTALGALAGWPQWLTIFGFSAVLGGVAALYLAWRKGRLRQTLANTGDLVRGELDLQSPDALTLPRGAVAFAAVALWVLIH